MQLVHDVSLFQLIRRSPRTV